MNDTELFRAALKTALESNFKNPEFRDSPAKGLKQFDRIVNLGRTPAFAFEIIHNCIASEQDTTKAIKSIKQQIFDCLEQANREKTIEGNKLLRVKRAASKWNERMAAVTKNVQVRVGNRILKIDESEYDAQRYDMPNISRETYTAVASDRQGKERGRMEVEIRLFGNR